VSGGALASSAGGGIGAPYAATSALPSGGAEGGVTSVGVSRGVQASAAPTLASAVAINAARA
jgi:hypothetical protein